MKRGRPRTRLNPNLAHYDSVALAVPCPAAAPKSAIKTNRRFSGFKKLSRMGDLDTAPAAFIFANTGDS